MDKELEQELRHLMRKWISKARHPMRTNRPEERDLLLRCESELRAVVARHRQEPADPPRTPLKLVDTDRTSGNSPEITESDGKS